jgi:hypothetical protein
VGAEITSVRPASANDSASISPSVMFQYTESKKQIN